MKNKYEDGVVESWESNCVRVVEGLADPKWVKLSLSNSTYLEGGSSERGEGYRYIFEPGSVHIWAVFHISGKVEIYEKDKLVVTFTSWALADEWVSNT